MHAAHAINLASESTLTDKGKLRRLKEQVNRYAPSKKDRVGAEVDELDLPSWFTKIEHAINERKEGYQDYLEERMMEVIDKDSFELQANTSIQKSITD